MSWTLLHGSDEGWGVLMSPEAHGGNQLGCAEKKHFITHKNQVGRINKTIHLLSLFFGF